MQRTRYRENEDYRSVDVESDPLTWWKDERKQFPCFSCLARKYLCICGTSVPSERLFSKGGYIVNLLRNGLSPQHVNILGINLPYFRIIVFVLILFDALS